jgi:hypothetical protein
LNPPPPTHTHSHRLPTELLEGKDLKQEELDTMLACHSPIPPHAIVAMLRREVLLTRAKLQFLSYEHLLAERMLRSLKTQLRQVRTCSRGEAAAENLPRCSVLGPASTPATRDPSLEPCMLAYTPPCPERRASPSSSV